MNPIIVEMKFGYSKNEQQQMCVTIKMKEKRVGAWTSLLLHICEGNKLIFKLIPLKLVSHSSAQIGLPWNERSQRFRTEEEETFGRERWSSAVTKTVANWINEKWTIFFDLFQLDFYHYWNIKANFINIISIEWIFLRFHLRTNCYAWNEIKTKMRKKKNEMNSYSKQLLFN